MEEERRAPAGLWLALLGLIRLRRVARQARVPGVALGCFQNLQNMCVQAAARHAVPSGLAFKRAGPRRTGRRLMTKPWPLSIPRPSPIFETNRKATPWQLEMALQRRRERRMWAATTVGRERRRRRRRQGQRHQSRAAPGPSRLAPHNSLSGLVRPRLLDDLHRSRRIGLHPLEQVCSGLAAHVSPLVHVRNARSCPQPGKVGRVSAAGYVPRPPPPFSVMNRANAVDPPCTGLSFLQLTQRSYLGCVLTTTAVTTQVFRSARHSGGDAATLVNGPFA